MLITAKVIGLLLVCSQPFILVNNFGESNFAGCLLTASVLTPKIGDVFFDLLLDKGFLLFISVSSLTALLLRVCSA